ncbi:MAG: class I SAM-dependent methyltransferase [Oligoflexales bacterium]|nr:class I SAM-dependent methyltransferase [Oligoflexales bacterium]
MQEYTPPGEPAGKRNEPAGICPECHERSDVLHDAVADHSDCLEGRWKINICKNKRCGLAFIFPIPSRRELDSYYKSYYTHDLPKEPADFGASILSTRLLLKKLPSHKKRELLFLHDMSPSEVLEIGCGNGGNLIKLKRQGWKVTGQEVDSKAADVARGLGISVFCGELGKIESNKKYDAVIIIHVLEHLLFPDEMLKKIREILTPGGRLVIITPNQRSLGHWVFGRFWTPLAAPFHVRLYNISLLKNLMLRNGYETKRLFTCSTHSLPNIRASVKACLENAGHPAFFLRNRLLASFIIFAVFFIFLLLDLLSLAKGDECVAICRPR